MSARADTMPEGRKQAIARVHYRKALTLMGGIRAAVVTDMREEMQARV